MSRRRSSRASVPRGRLDHHAPGERSTDSPRPRRYGNAPRSAWPPRPDWVKLAVLVTALHFVIVLGFTPMTKRITARLAGVVQLHIGYVESVGVLSRILALCDSHQWALSDLTKDRWRRVLTWPEPGSGMLRARSPGLTE